MNRPWMIGLCGLCVLGALACGDAHTDTDDGGTRSDAAAARDTGVDDGGSPADPRACSLPSECVVTANTCCGECGPATLAGSTAIHTDNLAAYRDELCADDPLCPGCPSAPNPELIATCDADRCEVVDIGMDAMTACASPDECVVRTVACCECGGPTDSGSLIALRADARAAYESLVCDPGTACAECAPVYPGDVAAVCEAGRCALTFGAP